MEEDSEVDLTLCALSHELDEENREKLPLRINIWALDEANTPHLIRIEDFCPHIYFEFPDPNEGKEWRLRDAKEVHTRLKKALERSGKAKHLQDFMKSDFELKFVLYYYQTEPRPMVKLSFDNLDTMRHAGNILNKGLYMAKGILMGRVLLKEIEPIRKLLTNCKLLNCGWFKCKVVRQVHEIDKISTLKHEYVGSYLDLIPFTTDKIVRPLWMSYDGEMNSSNHKAFPRMWKGTDCVYLTTMVFFRDGDDNTDNWIQYAILKGDCDETLISGKFILVKVRSEVKGLEKFAELIRKHDPDFLTGYNILAFDNKYFDARLYRLNKEWPVTGRLKGRTGPIKNINWGSDAYGEKDLYVPVTPGRVYLDFYEQVRRNYTWGSYSLANAAKMILKDPTKVKKDVEPQEQFECYDAMVKTLKAGKGDGLQRMSKVVDYGLWDSRLVCHMANKTFWWIGIMEMCRAVFVGPQVLLTGGQQTRVLNLLYNECVGMNVVLDSRVSKVFYYEGGLVQQPDVGFHKGAAVLDFKSLYPTVMIGHNLCYTTLIDPEDHKKYKKVKYERVPVKISEKKDLDEKLDAKKRKDLVYEETDFRFVDKDVKVGVLPLILRKLLDARAKARGVKTNDPVLAAVMDQRQLALKVCANSVYGFTGVVVGPKKACLEVAATTTFLGRESITKTINWILEHYPGAHLVYGDTDSCMITVKGVPIIEMHDFARAMARAVEASGLFPPPMELEMEGIFDIFAVKQKNYAKFTYYDPKGRFTPPGMGGCYMLTKEGLPELTVKGMTPTRRDTCQWCKHVFVTILMLIMRGHGYWACVEFMIDQVVALYNYEISLMDLVVSKKMGSGYTSETATMKVFGEEMAKLGKQINPGERHEYVVTKAPTGKKLNVGKRMLLLSVYNDNLDDYELDCQYYFENLLAKKLDTILTAAYHQDKATLDRVRITVRRRVYTAYKPAKMLCQVIKANPAQIQKMAYKIESRCGQVGL